MAFEQNLTFHLLLMLIYTFFFSSEKKYEDKMYLSFRNPASLARGKPFPRRKTSGKVRTVVGGDHMSSFCPLCAQKDADHRPSTCIPDSSTPVWAPGRGWDLFFCCCLDLADGATRSHACLSVIRTQFTIYFLSVRGERWSTKVMEVGGARLRARLLLVWKDSERA